MEFSHIGKGHLDGGRSGRYPWGSGDNPHQRVEGAEKQKYKVIRGYKNLSTSELEHIHEALKREDAKKQLILEIEKLDAKLHNRRLEEKDKGYAKAFRDGLRSELGEQTRHGLARGIELGIKDVVSDAIALVGKKYLVEALNKKINATSISKKK